MPLARAPTAYENAQAMVHYFFDSTFTVNTFGWYVHTNLDVAVSSRSTLTASDNIGINWADITNPTTSVNLSGYNFSTSQVVARADSVTGVGRLSTNGDKINYRLSAQGLADVWTEDTTDLATGWAQYFKAIMNATIASRSTFNPATDSIIQKFSSKAFQAKIGADSLQARYSFSLLLPGLKMMGAVGDSQQYFYNSKGLMDTMRYWSGATLVSRTLYVRTADSLAPRLTRTYSLP